MMARVMCIKHVVVKMCSLRVTSGNEVLWAMTDSPKRTVFKVVNINWIALSVGREHEL